MAVAAATAAVAAATAAVAEAAITTAAMARLTSSGRSAGGIVREEWAAIKIQACVSSIKGREKKRERKKRKEEGKEEGGRRDIKEEQEESLSINRTTLRFLPSHLAVNDISEIFKDHYIEPWTSWKKTTPTVRDLWFNEFMDVFCHSTISSLGLSKF